MLDFALVAMDLVMHYGLQQQAAGGGARDGKMLRALKIVKGARAMRVVGRVVKVPRARRQARAPSARAERARAPRRRPPLHISLSLSL